MAILRMVFSTKFRMEGKKTTNFLILKNKVVCFIALKKRGENILFSLGVFLAKIIAISHHIT